jgi:hypothetical protein
LGAPSRLNSSALQTGFSKVARIGNGSGRINGEATGWVKAMDFHRRTQQLCNLSPVISRGALGLAFR